MIDEIKTSKEEERDIIARYMARESEWDGAEAESVREMLDDLRMENGQQWNQEMRMARGNRPTLTINKLSAPCKRIANEFKQNTIGIYIKSQNADEHCKTIAEVRQGLIRQIEKVSKAQVIYGQAFDMAVKCGVGYYRVISDYATEKSFNQDIKIEIIPNNFAVKMDHRRKWAWGHDAKWAIINDEITREEFNDLYPDSDMAQGGAKTANYNPSYYSEKTVKVSEYFEIRHDKDVVLLLKDGSEALKSKYDGPEKNIAQSRPTMVPHCHWYKLTCHEVLEHSVIPIRYIPIVCMPGDITYVNGKRYLRSLIRFAKDSQRSYNLNKSNAQEKNNLAPKAPWVATIKQIKGFEKLYNESNISNQAVLPYNGDPEANGPPQRQGYVNQSAGDERLAMEDADDIKTTTGVYDPALGAQSNETTGIAIRARSGQSQTVNYNFHANAATAIEYGGLIINEWLQHVYDAERIVTILGPDMKEKVVKLNSEDPNDPLSRFKDDDEKYDVSIETGPAYQTQMQEAFEMISGLMPNMDPEERSLAYDKLMANLNFQGAQELQERFANLAKKKFPDIIRDAEGRNLNQSQAEQLAQEVQQLQDMLNKANQALDQYAHINDQMQAQIAQLSDNVQKEIKLKEIEHEHHMEELKFQASKEFKLKEMENNAKLEQPILENMIALGSQNMAISNQLQAGMQAPAYAEQSMEQEYQEQDDQESPEMGVQNEMPEMSNGQGMTEQMPNVPAQSPAIPAMEQNNE